MEILVFIGYVILTIFVACVGVAIISAVIETAKAIWSIEWSKISYKENWKASQEAWRNSKWW